MGTCTILSVLQFIPNTEALVLHYSEGAGAGAGCAVRGAGAAFLCTR